MGALLEMYRKHEAFQNVISSLKIIRSKYQNDLTDYERSQIVTLIRLLEIKCKEKI